MSRIVKDPQVSTLIIGAGFAGLGMAVRLLQEGVDDFVILERGDRVGGTWRDNTGWVLPRADFRHPEWAGSLFKAVPASQSAARSAWFLGHEAVALGLVWDTPFTSLVERAARQHLRRQVRNPWMRRQLTPDFRAGCKRMLMSSDYYPALQADNCKLFTWPIATLSPAGIRTSDGIEHHLDAIVFATGFDVSKQGTPFEILSRGGRSLDQEWATGVHAYKSVSVSGYPNLFFTFGPNSGPGHNSALVYMEHQINYAVKAVKAVLAEDLFALDVRPDVQARYNRDLQKRLSRTTWNSGCRSWYLTDDGFNGTMYPGFATQFARQMAKFEPDDYERVSRSSVPRVVSAVS